MLCWRGADQEIAVRILFAIRRRAARIRNIVSVASSEANEFARGGNGRRAVSRVLAALPPAAGSGVPFLGILRHR